MNGVRTITLSETLCSAAEERFAGRFSSIDELVAELLEKLLSDNAAVMDEQEQLIIEERLKDLGYV